MGSLVKVEREKRKERKREKRELVRRRRWARRDPALLALLEQMFSCFSSSRDRASGHHASSSMYRSHLSLALKYSLKNASRRVGSIPFDSIRSHSLPFLYLPLLLRVEIRSYRHPSDLLRGRRTQAQHEASSISLLARSFLSSLLSSLFSSPRLVEKKSQHTLLYLPLKPIPIPSKKSN